MKYRERFEDDGFVYELAVQPSHNKEADLHTYSQGEGYLCQWTITGKQNYKKHEVVVTDDECEVIVYHSIEAAITGAREFLSI